MVGGVEPHALAALNDLRVATAALGADQPPPMRWRGWPDLVPRTIAYRTRSVLSAAANDTPRPPFFLIGP